MGYLLIALGTVAGIGCLICFILVVIEMFKRDQQALGIICVVGVIVCGIGPLIAFIYGWVKAKEWNITKLMTIYTACVIGSIVLNGAYYALVLPEVMNEIQNEIDKMEMDVN